MWKLLLLFMIPLFILCTTPQENKVAVGHIPQIATTPIVSHLVSEPTKSYPEILADINKKQLELSKIYSNQPDKKDSCILTARSYLLKQIFFEIFPSWYGTEWDFNGVTRTPRKGKIACGYFVTTVLQDVGFRVPRIKWAQQVSEYYIKRLASDDIHRFSNKSVDVIIESMKARGEGMYIVGLDSHVGFILVKDGHPLFIHSDYYEPNIGVMAEELDSDNPLKDSNYRVIGKIFSDEMLVNWLEGNTYLF